MHSLQQPLCRRLYGAAEKYFCRIFNFTKCRKVDIFQAKMDIFQAKMDIFHMQNVLAVV